MEDELELKISQAISCQLVIVFVNYDAIQMQI